MQTWDLWVSLLLPPGQAEVRRARARAGCRGCADGVPGASWGSPIPSQRCSGSPWLGGVPTEASLKQFPPQLVGWRRVCIEGVGSHLFGLLGSPSLPRTLSTHVQFRAQTEASWDLCLSQGTVWGKSLSGQFWIAQRAARPERQWGPKPWTKLPDVWCREVKEALSFSSRTHSAQPWAILSALPQIVWPPGPRRQEAARMVPRGPGPGDLNQCQRMEREATFLLLMIV